MIQMYSDQNLVLLKKALQKLSEQVGSSVELNNFMPIDAIDTVSFHGHINIVCYSLDALKYNNPNENDRSLINVARNLDKIASKSENAKVLYLIPDRENVNILDSIEDRFSPVSDYQLIKYVESYCYNLEKKYKNFNFISAKNSSSQKERIKCLTYLKSPITHQEADMIANNIIELYEANKYIKKKVILVDLDNTIWGGVVGEDGPLGVKIGYNDPTSEIYSYIQKYLFKLRCNGVLLASVSKNNYQDVFQVFEKNANMILKMSDFVVHKINWKSKAENIKEISNELKLNCDSFVFFDDNFAEQEKVRSELPTVEVIEHDGSPIGMLESLYKQRNIIPIFTTQEDAGRTESYQRMMTSTENQDVAYTYEHAENIAKRLELIVERGEISKLTENRINQLFNKTNQFNFTTRRLRASTTKEILHELSVNRLYYYNVSDKYGNYGLVGMVSLSFEPETIVVKDFIMSCRVLGRGVEQAILNNLINDSIELKRNKLEFDFTSTNKNKPAELFLQAFFKKSNERFVIDQSKLNILNNACAVTELNS